MDLEILEKEGAILFKGNIYSKMLQKANEIGISGFAKNRPDGSVYIEAEAEPEIIEQFVEWCKRGPSWSRVDNLIVTDITFNNYRNFCIK